jgi:hypothetical protein
MTAHPKKSIPRAILELILAFVFTVVGASEMFPLKVNVLLYLSALALVWFGVKQATESKTKRAKIGWPVVALLVSLLLIYFPLQRQYNREINLHIHFKESPDFFWWRRQIITHDIARMRDYFISLEIPVPEDLPAIGVQTGPNSGTCGQVTPPGLPLYRSEIVIGESSVKNRQTVTSCYSDYVVGSVMSKALAGIPWPIPPDRIGELGEQLMLSSGFSQYFVWSFWDAKTDTPGFGIWFWDIRERLGSDYTDRLAAATLRATSDSPAEGRDDNVGLYLAAKIKIGESVVDNECSKWPQIESVLLKGGVDRVKLKGQDLTHSAVTTACIEQWKE